MRDALSSEGANARLSHDWAALAPLLDQLLDASREQRAAVLDVLSAGDPERRSELERLAAECDADAPLLNRPAPEVFDGLVEMHAEMDMPSVVSGRYRMGRVVGRGGMAVVYVARDEKHDRDVAIKVVRSELAASLGRDRFLREIAIAARLRHPNILPLYDSGDADGALYFVMPFEGGPSLQQRLTSGGPLPIAEALSILRDVARALQYAHAQGVVHRDIKPDNVLMSGGAAVVADFGIAKAFSSAQTGGSSVTATQAGAGIGTPAYMAPEQAVGDPSTDQRADIYSFGCLAYALFSGDAPFDGQTPHQLISAHVATIPRLLRERRGDVPEPIERLVARCLEKDPGARPQSASALLAVLEEPGMLGAQVHTAPGDARFGTFARMLAGAVAVALMGAFGWMSMSAGESTSRISLAVLPFGNMAADSTAEFLTDGLPDEIAAALSRVPGIQIKSRSGARLFRGRLGVDATEAGVKLGADYVMTGVVRRDHGNWILSADITRAADRATIWGEAFTLNPDQQAGAVETILRSAVAALRDRFPKIVGSAPQVASRSQTNSGLAMSFYLGGKAKLSRRGQSVKEAVDLFSQAIHEDSLFAPGYAGLSMALALSPFFQKGVRASDVFEQVQTNASRALALDATQMLAHVALGVAYENNRQWGRAESEFKQALRLQPDDAEALIQYGRYLGTNGRLSEAIEQLRSATRTDPASAVALAQLSYTYYLLGRQDSARVISERAVRADSQNVPTRSLGALVRLRDGDLLGARVLATNQVSLTVCYVLVAVGDTAAAFARLHAIEQERPPSSVLESTRALTWLALKDTLKAMSSLSHATDGGEIWFMLQAPGDPIYDGVRRSDGFRNLVHRLGLPASSADVRPETRTP